MQESGGGGGLFGIDGIIKSAIMFFTLKQDKHTSNFLGISVLSPYPFIES